MRKCFKCKTEFDDKINNCPNCGTEYINKGVKIGCYIIMVIILLLVIGTCTAINKTKKGQEMNTQDSAVNYSFNYMVRLNPGLIRQEIRKVYQDEMDKNNWVIDGLVFKMVNGHEKSFQFHNIVIFNADIPGNYSTHLCAINWKHDKASTWYLDK